MFMAKSISRPLPVSMTTVLQTELFGQAYNNVGIL